jgi:hypothetical protein
MCHPFQISVRREKDNAFQSLSPANILPCLIKTYYNLVQAESRIPARPVPIFTSHTCRPVYKGISLQNRGGGRRREWRGNEDEILSSVPSLVLDGTSLQQRVSAEAQRSSLSLPPGMNRGWEEESRGKTR